MTDSNNAKVWNYLVYNLLQRLDKEQPEWRSVTSGQFSKLPCIADRYLIDELGRDIEFPRYWYKYGEVGNRDPIDSSLYIQDEADWGGIEIRPSDTDINFDLSESLKSDIDESINFIIDNFSNLRVEKIKSIQYEHFAPNDFIRAFEKLRAEIYDLAEHVEDKGFPEDYGEKKDELMELMEELSDNYPESQYDRMESDFIGWVRLMRELIEADQISKAEAQLEEFWAVFSKVHLRIEHNNNPIEDQLERWELENEFELEKYRSSLTDILEGTE